LGINSRVAHFAAEVAPTCTFCTLANRNDAENETVLHLFYSCSLTEELLNPFFRWGYNESPAYNISRAELFGIQEGEILGDGARWVIRNLVSKLFFKIHLGLQSTIHLPRYRRRKRKYQVSTQLHVQREFVLTGTLG